MGAERAVAIREVRGRRRSKHAFLDEALLKRIASKRVELISGLTIQKDCSKFMNRLTG